MGTRVTTLGAQGVRIERAGQPVVEVGCAQEEAKVDPTGVGDAFRAGFLAGVTWVPSARRGWPHAATSPRAGHPGDAR
ncbi:PfkB family carbohydrate kinase [Streptomyces cinnamoneus]|uniref:PfkB family carbohydrate kinase n=1 Tax=Streptomyces cinnamoneus TaxID=53446 RepID=UPI0026B6303B